MARTTSLKPERADVKDILERLKMTPALDRVLNNQFARPDGCAGCPFARNPQDINPDDPDEGHYDCELLQKEAIWGEEPECEGDDWRERARDERENSWQPIETAPKDGTAIIGYSPSPFFDGRRTRVVVVHWVGELQGWSMPGVGGLRLSHWMSLPPPPHTETKEGQAMNLHWEDIEVEGFNGLVRRYWFDDQPPSPEAEALMDEIVREFVFAPPHTETR